MLWVGGERHERPDPEQWRHKIWAVSEAEYRRLVAAQTVESGSRDFDLATAKSLF